MAWHYSQNTKVSLVYVVLNELYPSLAIMALTRVIDFIYQIHSFIHSWNGPFKPISSNTYHNLLFLFLTQLDRTKQIYFKEESSALETHEAAKNADDIARGRKKDVKSFFQSKGPSMSLPNNFNHQIYPSALPVLFSSRWFYLSNVLVLFTVKNFDRTFFVVELYLSIKSTGEFDG